MKVENVISFLNEWAPELAAEQYDNVGLQVGRLEAEVEGILVALEVSREVIEEAAGKQANLIVTHHPLIFRSLTSLTGSNHVEELVEELIRKDMMLYAMHTNLDSVIGGVNYRLGEILGLKQMGFLSQKDEDAEIGMGVIGTLENPLYLREFLDLLKKQLRISYLRVVGDLNKEILRIAVCGGAGSMLLEKAINKGADVFVTADIKYHTFFDARERIALVDAGHFETEFAIVETIYQQLSHWLKNHEKGCTVFATETNTNPITYY